MMFSWKEGGGEEATRATPILPPDRESKYDTSRERSTNDKSLDHGVRLDVDDDDSAADDDV
jgi:hypothetical protein